MSWAGSTRRARLPSDWPKRVARVQRRANGRCEARAHVTGCDGVGRECDHIKHGDDHDLTNLQWLSLECHKAKTQAEARAAYDAKRALLRLPTEAHPSMVERPFD